MYNWQGQKYIVPSSMISDSSIYRRYSWRDLENSEGVYNFAKIDNFISSATNNKQQIIIGLAQPMKASGKGSTAMPDYLTTPLAKPSYDSTVKGQYGTWWHESYYPDFNNTYVKQRFQALIKAFGDRYNNNPNIAFIQMMHYGAYGEYYIDSKAPSDVSRISKENAEFTVDMFRTYFPAKNLSVFLSNSGGGYITRYGLAFDNVGWSRAALGHVGQMQNVDELMKDPFIGELLTNKWKTAPVWTEMVGNYTMSSEVTAAQFKNAKDQVIKYHISYVGNGNFKAPYDVKPYNSDGSRNASSNWTEQQIQDFVDAGKLAGYRYAIQSVQIPLQLERASALTIKTNWVNTGVAPVYTQFNIFIQLRDSQGVVKWEQKSSTDLRKILPTGTGNVAISESITIPATIPAGTYSLTYIGKQGSFIMHFANPESSDGSVKVGTVEVK
jgi:hypothetical protein